MNYVHCVNLFSDGEIVEDDVREYRKIGPTIVPDDMFGSIP
jgi:hypothetical protein